MPESAWPTSSLYDIFSRQARENPDRKALSYYNFRYSYGELLEKVDAMAAILARRIGPGEIVPVIAPTTPEVIACLYALNKIGAVPSLVDIRFKPDRIRMICDRSQCKLLFVSSLVVKEVAAVIDQLSVAEVVVIKGSESMPDVAATWFSFEENQEETSRMVREDPRFVFWTDFMEETASSSEEIPSFAWPDSAPAFHFQTSGTSGGAKSVLLTNRNAFDAIRNTYVNLNDAQAGDAVLCIMPIFSFYGFLTSVSLPLTYGMSVIIFPFIAHASFLKLVSKCRPQHVFSAPSHWENVKNKKNDGLRFDFLKTPFAAGDILLPSYEKAINSYLNRHGCAYSIVKAYGMTETGGAVAIANGNHPGKYNLGFSGQPFPGLDIIVTGDEICVKSDGRFLGYFEDPKATDELIRRREDGSAWIHTGDVGRFDADGNLYVIDRLKRMIVRYDGSKVFPVEIENALIEHPSVAQCAVVPMDDPEHPFGYAPKAYVVLRQGEKGKVDESDLRIYCQDRLPCNMVPSRIVFLDALPLNSAGKVEILALGSCRKEK